MKYPTLFSVLCACFLFNAGSYPTTPAAKPTLSVNAEFTTCDLHAVLWANLIADQLINNQDELVKIEFEYHDIFVNQRILSYELIEKYHQLLTHYGVKPGSQRQIHLYANGHLAIGDVNGRGQMLVQPDSPVDCISIAAINQ
jgi:hypothetical protein